MLHLRHNGILMTAEIPMSPKSTDDWVETLQTRSIPLMVSNALRLDIYGPCEFCCISMLMKKQRKGHSRHSERLRSKALPTEYQCTTITRSLNAMLVSYPCILHHLRDQLSNPPRKHQLDGDHFATQSRNIIKRQSS